VTIGVLALQGCVDPHIELFQRLGAEVRKVRRPEDLESIDRIVLPGGESTTMLTLLDKSGLGPALLDFGRSHAVWGICAGAILIAREVEHPRQRSLGLIDLIAHRNHYGSQLESFTTEVSIDLFPGAMKVDFIRAPLLKPLSDKVTVHAKHEGVAVLLRQGRVLASSFHAELGEDTRLHRYFLDL
jgi:5'-phosphate synthase pdxT subunit